MSEKTPVHPINKFVDWALACGWIEKADYEGFDPNCPMLDSLVNSTSQEDSAVEILVGMLSDTNPKKQWLAARSLKDNKAALARYGSDKAFASLILDTIDKAHESYVINAVADISGLVDWNAVGLVPHALTMMNENKKPRCSSSPRWCADKRHRSILNTSRHNTFGQ